MFSEAQTSGSVAQYDGEKMPGANESQQCLSNWTKTPERHYVTEIA